MNNSQCGKEINHGIDCKVTNCKYNENKKYCTAKQICVGPSFASCSSETVCATFKPEDK